MTVGGDRAARASSVITYAVRHGHPHPQPPEVERLQRARPWCDGGDALRVPRARRADGRVRGGVGCAHARDVLPSRRRLPRPARAHAAVSRIEVAQGRVAQRSEEHTSELQSLMRISYAVFCLKKKKK